ncbi:hypothetical protein PQX77_018118 [Marasmius sp. AFHP31]|nr:hypothetical protein PQX77_018118 [Marasmius sp. AFHP31]
MASNGAIPPPISDMADDVKFDGGVRTNWATVRRKVLTTLKSQGLIAYVDGSVDRPFRPLSRNLRDQLDAVAARHSQTPITPQIYPPIDSKPAPTPVYSLNPSYEEWKFRNNRAKTIIEAHIEDILALVPNADDLTAFDIMTQLDRDYNVKNDLLRIDTNRKFRAFGYEEIESLDQYFKDLRELRKSAVEAGNTYMDEEYRSIVLSAFPTEAFDLIINNITTSLSE